MSCLGRVFTAEISGQQHNQSDGIRSRKSEYDKLRGFGLGFEK